MTGPLIPLGHGRQEREELADLLQGASIAHLIDVRRFPGSRANEAVARGQVTELCGSAAHRDHVLGIGVVALPPPPHQ